MTRYLALCCLLATVMAASVHAAESGSPDIAALVHKVGLAGDDTADTADASAPPADTVTDEAKSCAGVSFTRNLRYGESELNVLDVAAGEFRESSPQAVLVFVAGESFAGESATPDAAVPDEAMCFAARHGMVGVRVSYRLAPANPWPTAARDVAAATSWVHENIDLFGGNRDEIVAVGYSVGAFHVASLLAHREFQERDSDVAGAVLVSGIYRISADASPAEKAYFGADASKYDERSAFPGILSIETPVLLAWSALDPPQLVAQGETLKELMCNSPTHCPHTKILKSRDGLASVLGPDAASGSLVGPMLELVREIETRELP
jgi:acetyl esterase/lipase